MEPLLTAPVLFALAGRSFILPLLPLVLLLLLLSGFLPIAGLLVGGDLIRESKLPPRSRVYSFWLGHGHGPLDEPERAIAHGERALASATRVGDRVAMGKANYVIARARCRLTQYERGLVQGRVAVALLEQSDDAA